MQRVFPWLSVVVNQRRVLHIDAGRESLGAVRRLHCEHVVVVGQNQHKVCVVALHEWTHSSQCTASGLSQYCSHLVIKVHQESRGKVSWDIAQYPVLRIAQSALHFTSLADLFNRTLSQILCETSTAINCNGCWYTYPPLSIARYSFIQLSELKQCRVKKRAHGFIWQHRIRIRFLLVKSLKLSPWTTVP